MSDRSDGRATVARGWRPSVVTVAVVPVALGLVGNLATNTVSVSWRWWPAVVWLLVAGLVVVAVLVERARARAGTGPSGPAAAGPAAATPGPLQAPVVASGPGAVATGTNTGIVSTGSGAINVQHR